MERILFQKLGCFSLINDSTYKILQHEFSKEKVDIIDVQELLRNNLKYYHYIINIYYFLNEYLLDFLLGNKKWKTIFTWFLNTSYIGLLTNKFIQIHLRGKAYKFTFQTQSLFNGKLQGIPHFVYTDHTTKTNLHYPNINPKEYIRSKAFIKKVEAKIYNEADVIFTFGNLVTKTLSTEYNINQNKIVTAFAGSNTQGHFIENISKYRSKNILFVGVDWNRKGGPALLKVFEKILKVHDDASLTIVGCNPKINDLPNCQVIGKIRSSEIAEYYNKAALFFLPTLREPFGIVFVEAMHYKLPIIANNIGSIPDLVTNSYNGYLFDNDIELYAKQICCLLDNPIKCRELGENGYTLAKSKFNWESVGKTIKQEVLKNIN